MSASRYQSNALRTSEASVAESAEQTDRYSRRSLKHTDRSGGRELEITADTEQNCGWLGRGKQEQPSRLSLGPLTKACPLPFARTLIDLDEPESALQQNYTNRLPLVERG